MMTEPDIRSLLAATLNSRKPEDWRLDYRFLGDTVDSLDHASFVLALQERVGFHVPDEDLQRLDTIGNVMAYLEGRARELGH
jgi:acyl carrier protein